MYKEIKIDKVAVRETRSKLKKQRESLQDLKSMSKKLPFSEKGGHVSTGSCAQSMEAVTKKIPFLIDSLDQLILKTDGFLEDVLNEFSNMDNEISKKYWVGEVTYGTHRQRLHSRNTC